MRMFWHHSLVLVVQDVAMENKVAREVLIVRPHDDAVPSFDQNRVPEYADLIAVLRVWFRLGVGLLQFRAISLFIENAFAIGTVDGDDLERIYMGYGKDGSPISNQSSHSSTLPSVSFLY